MSDRVGICEEHEVEWAIVQHCRVCNLTAERDSLKAQRDALLAAAEAQETMRRYPPPFGHECMWCSDCVAKVVSMRREAIALAKVGQP